MENFTCSKREGLTAFLAVMALLLFCSETESWTAFVISKAIAIVLGIGAWYFGKDIKIEE